MAIATGLAARSGLTRGFYVWMHVACIATAFLGFLPTYWQPLAAGAFKANPVVHLHGVVFFGWTLFALAQSALIPARRVRLHRGLGLAGVSLATLVTVFGLLAALNSVLVGIQTGEAEAAKKFLIVTVSLMATFAVLFGLGVANIARPEAHKRLMLLATISLLNAPVARPLLVWVVPVIPPEQAPVWINIPACWLSYLLVLPPMIRDWRLRGRPHPVYAIGLPVLMLVAAAVVPLSETEAWMRIADGLVSLAGETAAGAPR
jgi:hypothetical protein